MKGSLIGIYCGRDAAARETPNFLVWWVVAIFCRSQLTCLFSESREVFRLNVANIGAVLQE
jgi:hypothetical protein